jgi:putative ABC transport system permease protein
MRTLLVEARRALVTLSRRPAGIVVPLLTMSIGIGASTAIFSALHAALFTPLPFPEPGRLVMGRATFGGEVNPWASAPDFFDYRQRSSSFESLSAYRPSATRLTIRRGDGSEAVPVTQVSWDLFRTLGVSPAVGRHFTAAEGERGAPGVAIVSHGYWQRSLGGSRDVVGRTLPLGTGRGEQLVTIVGVMPQGFRFAYAADVWVAMQHDAPGNDVRRFHNWMLLGRLKAGVSVARAQEDVDGISARLQKEYPDSNRNKALLVTPLQEALAEGDRPSLLILMAAVGVLLLVACADVAGLMLARGWTRQGEMAIRSALGATRGRLVAQLLAESVMVAVAAGAGGVVVAAWLRHLVLRLVPLDALGVSALPIGGAVLLFAAGATLVTSVIVGIVPAMLGTRVRAVDELKSGARTTDARGRSLALQTLVALQVAMSVVLLVAAALLGQSLVRLMAVDKGFHSDRLLTAQLWLAGQGYEDGAARARFFEALLDDFRALPGVTHATIVNNLPVVDAANNIPAWDAAHPPAQTSEAPIACIRFVLPGYFRSMGIPFVAGRDVSEGDAVEPVAAGRLPTLNRAPGEQAPVMVISRSLGRRLFGGADPIGRRIGIFTGGEKPAVAEVIGVVGDVRMNSLGDDYSLAMYVHYSLAAPPVMKIAVRTAGDPSAAAPLLRAALAKRDRGLVLDQVKTMDAAVAETVQGFTLRAGAVSLFGGAGLLLATLGVYGVLAFAVNRRRPDIGLRIVMGATRWDVVRWVLARGLGAVVAGIAVGLPAAFGVARVLREQLFQVPSGDAATFAGVTASLVAAALVACLLPAWRAIHVDPIVALKAE